MDSGDPQTDLIVAAAKKSSEAAVDAAITITGEGVHGLRERFSMWVQKGNYERAVSNYVWACDIAVTAGLPISAVPVKRLAPILEGMALEEDTELTKAWVALLANAATGNGSSAAAFAEILKQLEPTQAKVLADLHATTVAIAPELRGRTGAGGDEIMTRYGLSDEDYRVLADSLMRHRLVIAPATYDGLVDSYAGLVITSFGMRFVEACRPPGVVDPAPTILTNEDLDAKVQPGKPVPGSGSFWPTEDEDQEWRDISNDARGS